MSIKRPFSDRPTCKQEHYIEAFVAFENQFREAARLRMESSTLCMEVQFGAFHRTKVLQVKNKN